jgi:hypothetical protein
MVVPAAPQLLIIEAFYRDDADDALLESIGDCCDGFQAEA